MCCCATSKHNVQYLLGGHRAFFFDYMDAMGLSRYLPVIGLSQGRAGKGGLFRPSPGKLSAARTSRSGRRRCRPTRRARSTPWQKAIDYMRRVRDQSQTDRRRSCRSCRSMPAMRCARRSPTARSWTRCSCSSGCARSRRRRSWRSSRIASEGVIDSMLAVIAKHGPGSDQARAHRGAAARGDQARAHFRILPDHRGHRASTARRRISAGRRATSSRSIPAATTTAISATSAAWRSRASRMPSSRTCWARSKTIQRAAMKPIKAGAMGSEIYAAAEPLLQKSKHHNHMHFLAHGMGLVSHEAPRLTATGPGALRRLRCGPAARSRHGDLGRDHAARIRSAASSSSRTRSW